MSTRTQAVKWLMSNQWTTFYQLSMSTRTQALKRSMPTHWTWSYQCQHRQKLSHQCQHENKLLCDQCQNQWTKSYQLSMSIRTQAYLSMSTRTQAQLSMSKRTEAHKRSMPNQCKKKNSVQIIVWGDLYNIYTITYCKVSM